MNQAAFEAALSLFPGGVNSPVRSFRDVGGTPVFLARGRGAWVQDIGGKRYLDFCQSWGAHILGHGPSSVRKALTAQSLRGTSFGAPTLEEIRLGRLMTQAVPSLERLRFVSSGTEAVMSALRLARAATGRPLIVKMDGGYHGHSDGLLVQAGSGLAGDNRPAGAGIPGDYTRLTLSVPYNDLAAVSQTFIDHPEQIAAVILEPVAANMGVVAPAPGYLEGLRSLTMKYGALLIFDEVITGFRLGSGGAQVRFGVNPDLSTFGKIIGGGLPAGAYGGRKELMDLVAPAGPMYQAGTLSGNPAAMVCGEAVLREIRKPGFYDRLEDEAQSFHRKLEEGLAGAPVTINRVGTLLTMFFSSGPVTHFKEALAVDQKAFSRYFHSCLKAGVYLSPSPWEALFLGAAHKPKDLAWAAGVMVQAATEALKG